MAIARKPPVLKIRLQGFVSRDTIELIFKFYGAVTEAVCPVRRSQNIPFNILSLHYKVSP
ncbi:MAG: hypothetical protein HY785_20060 [Oscillatoriophycideae cyanobacterium NC_groundwater_1537_Pr4_S-0.65um_50_18]|nr:hypothetical protein [Oscillatoriophycideae cyanobacterium NC_groundwater_1537_Pr4_S-0.65um_50_18]